MVIPTLAADETLVECVRSVAAQTLGETEIIVVDNSGEGRANRLEPVRECARIVENRSNLGFGAAVNQGVRASDSPYIAVLNDDAAAHPEWLERMVREASSRYEIGMCAPQIRLYGEQTMDSAGMVLCRDGSSKQRGHLAPVSDWSRRADALLPSGCAALYKRAMLDEIGLFEESFFLYCEDTDLGLRARRKMWECVYVPGAVVEHWYSHSSGRASAMKAYFVERNRLRVAVRNLPARWLALAPLYSLVRYFWHAVYMRSGKGKAAEFRSSGDQGAAALPLMVLKAHADLLRSLPALWGERRRIAREGRMTGPQFARLLAGHEISPREVAAL